MGDTGVPEQLLDVVEDCDEQHVVELHLAFSYTCVRPFSYMFVSQTLQTEKTFLGKVTGD